MVPVTQAIVHKNTMMVKFLNTTVAKITMVCILRSQVLAVNANVVKMEFFLY